MLVCELPSLTCRRTHISLGDFAQLGIRDTTDLFGVYRAVVIGVVRPNGTYNDLAGVGSFTNNATTLTPDFTHADCKAIYGGTAYSSFVQLNSTGNYTARWNVTWAFPSTIDTSNPAKCSGLASTNPIENFVIERSFTVMDASSGSGHVTVSANATGTFTSKPTGVAYSGSVPQREVAFWLIFAALAIFGVGGRCM